MPRDRLTKPKRDRLRGGKRFERFLAVHKALDQVRDIYASGTCRSVREAIGIVARRTGYSERTLYRVLKAIRIESLEETLRRWRDAGLAEAAEDTVEYREHLALLRLRRAVER
jgi:hypothetical protein